MKFWRRDLFGVIVIVVFLLVLTGCQPRRVKVDRVEKAEYTLRESRVIVVVQKAGTGELVLFNMHDDENTAVEAGEIVLRRFGGQLVELRHSGERLIRFDLPGQQVVFDPNRMFTDAGARRTLVQYESFSEEAFQLVRAFADGILAKYGMVASNVIITLHNNGEEGYSAESYLPGAEYEIDAAKVHLEPGRDSDDFFFVTEAALFESLAESGYNVVLQNNLTATDDGSLSVLAAQKGIPYVNVEAEHGHLKEQVKMLTHLVDALRANGMF